MKKILVAVTTMLFPVFGCKTRDPNAPGLLDAVTETEDQQDDLSDSSNRNLIESEFLNQQVKLSCMEQDDDSRAQKIYHFRVDVGDLRENGESSIQIHLVVEKQGALETLLENESGSGLIRKQQTILLRFPSGALTAELDDSNQKRYRGLFTWKQESAATEVSCELFAN